MTASPRNPHNVLFIHAMSAWDNLNSIISNQPRVLNETAQFFSPNAKVMQVRGLNLYNDRLTRRHVMSGIREHIAQHGTIDELVIHAHGSSANISHFGGVERFLGELKTLQQEMGKPIASRIVFSVCEAFNFKRKPEKKIELMKSLARDLNAELVGATTSVATTHTRNPIGPDLFGRFIKFNPNGTITRDVLDTPPAQLEKMFATAKAQAKQLREIFFFPKFSVAKAASPAKTQTEYMRALGYDTDALAIRGLNQNSALLGKTLSNEAPWVAEHVSKVRVSPAPAKKMEVAGAKAVENGLEANLKIIEEGTKIHWGAAAAIGGIACAGIAYIVATASNNQQHRQALAANPAQAMLRG